MTSLGIEPTTFALLTQCSTTEPQEHYTLLLLYLTQYKNTVIEELYTQCWGKLLFKVMRYNIALLAKKVMLLSYFLWKVMCYVILSKFFNLGRAALRILGGCQVVARVCCVVTKWLLG